MSELYIVCQTWQLDKVRELLKEGETVTTNSYCFRPDTYVINHKRSEEDTELYEGLKRIAVTIPLQ